MYWAADYILAELAYHSAAVSAYTCMLTTVQSTELLRRGFTRDSGVLPCTYMKPPEHVTPPRGRSM